MSEQSQYVDTLAERLREQGLDDAADWIQQNPDQVAPPARKTEPTAVRIVNHPGSEFAERNHEAAREMATTLRDMAERQWLTAGPLLDDKSPVRRVDQPPTGVPSDVVRGGER